MRMGWQLIRDGKIAVCAAADPDRARTRRRVALAPRTNMTSQAL
jgi:hypothetical protein